MDRSFKFNLLAFIVAFSLGMIYVYLKTPQPKLVVKFPTPYNAGSVVYKDGADTCFVFKADQVACPKDSNKIKQQPIVE